MLFRRSQEKYEQALQFYNQALDILREVGDRLGEGNTLNNIGVVYRNQRKYEQALQFYRQALTIFQEEKDLPKEGAALSNVGSIYQSQGQYNQALEFFKRALTIFQDVGDPVGEGTTRNNIGGIYQNQARYEQALEAYNKALNIFQQINYRIGESATLNNIGNAYQTQNQNELALNYYKQSLAILRKIRDRIGEGATLNHIGAVYESQEQHEQALRYYSQSLAIFQEVEDRAGEGETLNNMSRVYRSQGKYEQALDCFNKALTIFQEVEDRAGEGETLNNMGKVYQSQGKYEQALDCFNKALTIFREIEDRIGEGITLNNIGGAYRGQKKYKKAISSYDRSLKIRREMGDRIGEGITLSNVAEIYTDINQTKQAIKHYEKALFTFLEVRSSIRRNGRKAFLQQWQLVVDNFTDLLIAEKEFDRAFEWANRFSTAELADYTRLANAQVADPELRKELDELDDRTRALQELNRKVPDDILARRASELQTEINAKRQALINRHPEVADLLEVTPEEIAALRETIPDNTLIVQVQPLMEAPQPKLAFFLLAQNEKLQVVTAEIDPETFNALLDNHRDAVENYLNPDFATTQTELYERLVRPIEREIDAFNPQQLSFILDSKLRYIPFETLRDPQTGTLLLEKYPINYLTRLSTRRQGNLPVGRDRAVLAIGNPSPKAKLDLPGAAEEAREVADLFPGSEAFLGEDAILDAFKTKASQFAILHLATHGCFQPEGCEDLGLKANTLLFADGDYPVADAALLGLQDVELVVLSACQAAQRTEEDGREIPGLAYLFERAGARATIASLWNAEDEATKAIVVGFYQNLKDGMTKGEALRSAKLNYIRNFQQDKGYAPHPFLWSPLVLVGDAR